MATSNERRTSEYGGRAFVSWLIAALFLVLLGSGVVLFAAPRCKDAAWTAWGTLGLTKDQWEALHVNAAALFALATAAHLALNWKAFVGYLRVTRARRCGSVWATAAAALTGAVLIAGVAMEVQPFEALTALSEGLKDDYASSIDRAPWPCAQRATVGNVAHRLGLSPEDALAALRRAGYRAPSERSTLLQVAADNGVAPADVFGIIVTASRCGG